MLIVLDGIHKCGFDAEFWQPLAQELCSPAVNVTLRNHVVAAFQQGEQRCSNCSHARSEEQRGVGTFEFRNRGFSDRVSRIAVRV